MTIIFDSHCGPMPDDIDMNMITADAYMCAIAYDDDDDEHKQFNDELVEIIHSHIDDEHNAETIERLKTFVLTHKDEFMISEDYPVEYDVLLQCLREYCYSDYCKYEYFN